MLSVSVECRDDQVFAGQELALKVTLSNTASPAGSPHPYAATFDEQQRDSLDDSRRRPANGPAAHRGHRKMSSVGSAAAADPASHPKRHVRKLSLVNDASLSLAIATSPDAERRLSLHQADPPASASPVTSPKWHTRRPSWLNQRRRSSQLAATSPTLDRQLGIAGNTEALVMLHAQISGHFMLDPTLVKAESFEHLKGKAFTGGAAAGGLIGTQTVVSDAWSFSNLKSILMDPAQSSLAELRETTSSRFVPILSMPPTILGVDLHLLPGQSQEFHLACMLPKSLPCFYHGKAIKISYSIKLTAQKPDNTFKSTELPLRLFGSLEKLYAPYACDKPHLFTQSPLICTAPEQRRQVQSTLTEKDFHRYLDNLLPENGSVKPDLLPSPTMERSGFFRPDTMQETISNYRRSCQKVARFDIARAGKTVGIITLPSVVFCASQVILGSIDLSTAQLACFGFELSLEVSETVSDWLAVKNADQTLLATRRVLSSQVETTAFAKETAIELPIPAMAPPSFASSAVQVTYNLLFEFLLADNANWLEERQGKHGNEAWPVANVETEPFECRIPIQILVGAISEASGGRGVL